MYIIVNIFQNIFGDNMENTGITRRIDDLGRIVIPKEIRKNLRIKDNDELEISILNDKILLSKFDYLKKDKVISCLLYCIGKKINHNVLFTSRDKVIDYYLFHKNEVKIIELNDKIISLIDERKFTTSDLNGNVSLSSEEIDLQYIICPLIINGDLIGSIILYSEDEINKKDELLIEFSKIFLEIYLE